MSQSLPILLILAGLVIVLGIVSIMAIALVAKRCRSDQQCSDYPNDTKSDQRDPWEESGKRLHVDYDEPE
ncbi:MAG: hypothetical protein ISR75_05735 [Phycisphaerales bacterium]|nr:hypothetical protein [Planctomycetota bacterium]MBL6997920.1 hypothetical protein [Phycisphaerales bacterium]